MPITYNHLLINYQGYPPKRSRALTHQLNSQTRVSPNKESCLDQVNIHRDYENHTYFSLKQKWAGSAGALLYRKFAENTKEISKKSKFAMGLLSLQIFSV